MAEKFVQVQTDGTEKEREGLVQSTGAADGGRIAAVDPVTGKFHASLMPEGVGADVIVASAFENLQAGDFVNIFEDSGVARVRKADASSYVKRATGFVIANVTAPAAASVYKEGSNTQLSGLTPGTEYFLSDSVPGGLTDTPVITSGHILQYVGTAISSTALDFEAARPIIRT